MRLTLWLRKRLRFTRSNCCVDCGFLGLTLEGFPTTDPPLRLSVTERIAFKEHYYRHRELRFPSRQEIAQRKFFHRNVFLCERQIWVQGDPTLEQSSDESFFSLLTQQRNCKYFFPYSPGFSPQQHLDLERQHRTNILLVKATIGGAFIGAALAIIAGYLH